MGSLVKLETLSKELAMAVQGYANLLRSGELPPQSTNDPLFDQGVSKELQKVQAAILSNVGKIRALVCGPADFLKHLTSQNEMLACLRWLGEFQILACIPLVGTVPLKDVAELSGVAEPQLSRVIRFTTTAMFLDEPEPGHVAHTPLSARFVSDPSLLDAALFLAEAAAPTALHMAPAAQKLDGGEVSGTPASAYNLALSTMTPFATACEQRPKLRRQWTAYLRHAGGVLTAEDSIDVLTQLQWANIDTYASDGSGACIVEVGPDSVSNSIARSLGGLYPNLRFLLQVSGTHAAPGAATTVGSPHSPELGPRITVTGRTGDGHQHVTDAAVYILHLPQSESAILGELKAHLSALRAGNGVMLILTPRVLPERGSLVDPEVEAIARSRDLSLRQLLNEGEVEMADLLEMISTVQDTLGKLVVAKKLKSHNNLIMALVVSYQPHVEI